MAHKDYSTAGFKLLPADKGPTKFTALQTILYSLLLIPVTLAPFFIGMCSYENVSGIISLSLIGLANLFMIGTAKRTETQTIPSRLFLDIRHQRPNQSNMAKHPALHLLTLLLNLLSSMAYR